MSIRSLESESLTSMAAHVCACGKAHARGEFSRPGTEPTYPPDLRLRPVHIDLSARFDLAAETMWATATLSIEATVEGRDEIELHAVDFAEVGEVWDVDGRTVTWRYDGKTITARWHDAFERDEVRKLGIEYRITSPVAGMYFSRPTEATPDAPWAVGTDNETERARHWLPTIDLPSVRPTLSFALRADAAYTALANGALDGEPQDHDDGTRTTRWRLDQPCPSYLTCLCVGDLVRWDDGEHAGAPVAAFTPPPFGTEHLERAFGRTREMLAWITDKLDQPLPYPKYFQFALPEIGGAMENISLVAWDDFAILDEVAEREIGWLVDQVNLHEMAHTWFGDLVVCRDFAHAWLKESWATYMEQCWLEDRYGADERDYDFYSNLQAYFAEADGRYVRPIVTRDFATSWDMYDRHLYPGGAARLHMLRGELGDDVFWRAVRAYLERHKFEVVETDDFRRILESTSGRSLGRFFDQWIHGKGYPQLEVSFEFDAEKQRGRFEIEQAQVDDDKGIGLFDFALDLGWTEDGVDHLETVRIHKKRDTFIVPMRSDPSQVRVDPTARTVCKIELNPGDDKLREQLVAARDVIGRILAGDELIKTARRPNIEAVRDAWADEPFWGVRVRWGTSLANAATAAAVQALAHVIGIERDPKVLHYLLEAAGRVRDPEIAAALTARLDDTADPLPYRARARALTGLGNQRDAVPMERLVAALDEPSFKGVVQIGAARGIAASRHPDALDILLERLEPGAISYRVRSYLAEIVGGLGRVLERRDRERLVDALVARLRDPDPRVQHAAADGLGEVGEARAIPAIESWSRQIAAQERVHAERLIATIRKSGTRKDQLDGVDKLEQTLRKLEERVGKLEAELRDRPAR